MSMDGFLHHRRTFDCNVLILVLEGTLHNNNFTFPESYAYLLPEHGTAGIVQRIGMLFRQLIDFSRQEALYTEAILYYALSLLIMEITQGIY